jgi:hypothetical protein
MRPRVDLIGSDGIGLAVEICTWSSDCQRGGALSRLTDLGGTHEVPRLLFHVFRVWEVLPADELEHVVDIEIDGRIHLARIAGRLVDLTAYERLERRLLSGAEIHERAFEQRVLIVHDRLRWEYPKDDNEALGDRYGLGSFLYDYASRLSGNHDPDENEGENDDRPQALADGFDDICNAIASAASDQEAVDALADAMLGDPDLMPYVLERALEARGMDKPDKRTLFKGGLILWADHPSARARMASGSLPRSCAATATISSGAARCPSVMFPIWWAFPASISSVSAWSG